MLIEASVIPMKEIFGKSVCTHVYLQGLWEELRAV